MVNPNQVQEGIRHVHTKDGILEEIHADLQPCLGEDTCYPRVKIMCGSPNAYVCGVGSVYAKIVIFVFAFIICNHRASSSSSPSHQCPLPAPHFHQHAMGAAGKLCKLCPRCVSGLA